MYVGEDEVPRRLTYIGSVEGNPVYMYSPHEDVRFHGTNKKRAWGARKKKKTARGRYNRSAATRAKMSAAQKARYEKARAAKAARTASPAPEL